MGTFVKNDDHIILNRQSRKFFQFLKQCMQLSNPSMFYNSMCAKMIKLFLLFHLALCSTRSTLKQPTPVSQQFLLQCGLPVVNMQTVVTSQVSFCMVIQATRCGRGLAALPYPDIAMKMKDTDSRQRSSVRSKSLES